MSGFPTRLDDNRPAQPLKLVILYLFHDPSYLAPSWVRGACLSLHMVINSFTHDGAMYDGYTSFRPGPIQTGLYKHRRLLAA